MEETSRPIGVTILAVLSGVAALIAVVHTLQMLHILPFRLFGGEVSFFGFSFLGAVLYGVLALIWIWVARGLWNLDPQAWLFVVVMAVLYIILDVLAILGQSSWQELALSLVVSAVILAYALSSGVKSAFQVDEMQAEGEAARIRMEKAEAAAASAAAAAYDEAMQEGAGAADEVASETVDTVGDAVQDAADAVTDAVDEVVGEDDEQT